MTVKPLSFWVKFGLFSRVNSVASFQGAIVHHCCHMTQPVRQGIFFEVLELGGTAEKTRKNSPGLRLGG